MDCKDSQSTNIIVTYFTTSIRLYNDHVFLIFAIYTSSHFSKHMLQKHGMETEISAHFYTVYLWRKGVFYTVNCKLVHCDCVIELLCVFWKNIHIAL